MSAEVRLRRLQQLVLDPGFLGLEPLLDLLLGVHQELGASDLAQDKYVADFLEWGECPPFCRGFSTLHPLPPAQVWGWGQGRGRRWVWAGCWGQDGHRASFPFRSPELGATCASPCAPLGRAERGQQRPG